MATSEERMKILKMLEEGKLTASEATALLNALGEADETPSTYPHPIKGATKPKWVRLKVTEIDDKKERVNVNLPLSVVQSGLSFVNRFEIEIDDDRFDQVRTAVQSGQQGKVLDVMVGNGRQRLEVYLE